MTKRDDIALLREFAATESEAAFVALVERHINVVYSVALRSTCNAHAAQEISQAVFIILARKAKGFSRRTVLSGWLYQTTRLTAANFLRGEIRRQQREQEAYMQSTLNETANETWRQIAPQLDDAMAALGERDRNAIVLRFFENKNLREVGVALGASEDAAKMRVNRALEKLRKTFSKRGVSSTTAIIAGAVSANSVQAAPLGLAKTISAVAIAKGAAAGGSTLVLVKGALKIMAWTKMKTALIAGTIVLLAAGTATTFVTQHKHKLHGGSPQIHIKARFIEIPKGSDDFLNSFSGILDANSAQTFLQTIRSKRGVETLAEPEAVTTSGRQTQMRATQIITVITNSIFQETNSTGSVVIQTTKVETGPIFDVVPVVLGNGQIQMTTIASTTEFFGYADPSNLSPLFATNSAGQQITLPIFLPALQIKQALTKTMLADGQSLLLIVPTVEPPSFPDAEREARVAQHIADAEKKNGEKTTILLVTVNLVDSAGNLIHPNVR
ncbi:MAG TPA: sigma-70 family RNA polymerase sigma factor [Verrucomicrobiae bacterium]|jgi:RNA polymerase sigma factor (sigma-70 family)|nr:sigma-70 family RNA polymerase sigma factor [Verrucomicrobiae bacterium]